MTPHNKFNVAIVGSSTLKGEEVKAALAERAFPIRDIKLLDEIQEDADAILTSFMEEARVILKIQEDSFEGIDITFFCCEPDSVKHYLSLPPAENMLSLDLSQAVEPGPSVPVIIPGVNDPARHNGKGVVACPCALTVPIALLLNQLSTLYTIDYVNITALEPVSEFGKKALEELHRETIDLVNFSRGPDAGTRRQRAFNLIPSCMENGTASFSAREARIRLELDHVLKPASIPLSIAVIQAPVFHGHAISVFAKLNEDAEEEEVRTDLMRNGIPVAEEVVSPVEAVGASDFFVSRIRREPGQPGCYWFWIVGDNLKRAAAVNAVMTAESIISRL